jgi:hypothetical protein
MFSSTGPIFRTALMAVTAATVGFLGCASGKAPYTESTGSVEQAATGGCNETNPGRPLTCPNDTGCKSVACGGQLWTNGVIPFSITTSNPQGVFSPTDLSRIRQAAALWTSGSNGVVNFQECASANCPGKSRWLSIQPTNSGTNSGGNPLFLNPGFTISSVSHELGHQIGLPHTFERHDRDRYVGLTSSWFCSNGGVPWKCKQWSSGDSTEPAIPTGSFGPYNSLSIMNYVSADICEDDGLEPDDTGPTDWDSSSAIELYRTLAGWAPFQSLGKSTSSLTALDYTLASNVNMAASSSLSVAPAVASFADHVVNIFVRGTDDHIYQKRKTLSGSTFAGWTDWSDHGGSFNSNPAAVSWASGRIDLVARKTDENIYIRQFSGSTWTSWASIGMPSGGAKSSPAIASWGPGRLDVFVRGSDNQLYKKTCNGSSTSTCAASSSNWGSWGVVGAGGTFLGDPSAVSEASNQITVAVHGMDHAVWTARLSSGSWNWSQVPSGTMHFVGSIAAGPAITSRSSGQLDLVIRGGDSRLYNAAFNGSSWSAYYTQGGVLAGSPAVTKVRSSNKLEVVAPMVDHGKLGVWRKYFSYVKPCYYAGSTCGSCGCGGAGQPACVAGDG